MEWVQFAKCICTLKVSTTGHRGRWVLRYSSSPRVYSSSPRVTESQLKFVWEWLSGTEEALSRQHVHSSHRDCTHTHHLT
eukprot:2543118-Amphidinium_carterae.1